VSHMDPSIAVVAGVVLVVLVAIGVRLLRPSKDTSRETSQQGFEHANPYADEDAQFENAMEKLAGSGINKHVYTKIVGITFKNEDGTVGEQLIERCKRFDFLRLVPEPNNRFDPNAMGVCLENGSRIGYLESRLAGEVTRSLKRGYQWRACVKLAKAPESRRHGTLILCLVRQGEPHARRKDAADKLCL
jgi:hypothetical protein